MIPGLKGELIRTGTIAGAVLAVGAATRFWATSIVDRSDLLDRASRTRVRAPAPLVAASDASPG